MKLTALLLVVACLQVSANGHSQGITLQKKNLPLEQVFIEINKQTGYNFLYKDEWLKNTRPVDINVTDASLKEVLDICFRDQPVTYEIQNKGIVIRKKEDKNSSNNSLPPITVKGRITDEAGEPVVATITVKGTDNAISSEANGYYSLMNVDEKATLVVSSVSIDGPVEVKVNSRVTINVTVKRKVAEGEETIVVAYNTTTAARNVSSLTVIKGEQIQNLPNRSFDKSLQGFVPGLLVNSGSGQPGGSTNNFVLRGIATGGIPNEGQTFNRPLIVIDGVPAYQDPVKAIGVSDNASESNPMAQLNPSDIESITVLKDAAAISLYGSKASNGVVLVTTKRGKTGKTIISLRHQTDISERLKDPEVLSQDEYLELLFEAYKNSFPGITDQQILTDLRSSTNPNTSVVFPTIVKAPGDTSFYLVQDWNKEFYNNAAVTLANEISVSGGNERSDFYLNLEYTKQNGVIRHTGFDRKSIRFNYENRVASWLKLGINTTSSYSVQNYEQGTSFLLSLSPLLPIRDLNGQYIYNYSWGLAYNGSGLVSNPLAAPELNIKRNTAYHGLSKLYGEIKFLNYFTFTANAGVDFVINENKEKTHLKFVLAGESQPGTGSIRDQTVRNANFITTNILRFDRIIQKDHSINILLGQEAQVLTNRYGIVERRGFQSNPAATEPNNGSTVFTAQSNASKQTLLSYFSQVNYGFRNKYFVSGSIRTDGSSQFGDNNRFGSYWSVGGGWIATSETFMKKTSNWLSYLKLRGSFGVAGNSAAISNTLRYDQLSLFTFLNNSVVYPNRSFSPGNPDIQWEETFNWDAGIEMKFWKDRIAITADRYNRKTTNLIAQNVLITPATGFGSLTQNIGDLKNTGIELMLSVDLVRTENFRWNVNANWSKNESKLTRAVRPEVAIANNIVNKVGEPYNAFNLRVWAGVNPDNGRPMWIDSTGKPSENYNAAKPQITGKAQPDGFGSVRTSFSYKQFELSAMIYYQYGFQIYLINTLQNDGSNPFVNQTKDALDRWQKPGDIAANPRRLWYGTVPSGTADLGTSPSTRYLYNGDFIRLSNVMLSYRLPKRILDLLHLGMGRVYIQGNNLATWTKYVGQDPENVHSNHRVGNYLYPQQRSFSFGFNLSF